MEKSLSIIDLAKMLIMITKQVPKGLSSRVKHFALKELVEEGKLLRYDYSGPFKTLKLFFNEEMRS